MNRRIVPRWKERISLGEMITPLFVVALLLASIGGGVLVAGVLLERIRLVLWGIVWMIPFFFACLLLWRLYQNDRYLG